MSGNARLAVLVVGALLLAGGLALTVLTHGGGIGLIIIGALVMLSVVVERRYRRPGAPTQTPLHHFEPTRERFVDQESGRLLEVWVDPLTGERRYEPVADDTQLMERKP